MTLIKLSRFFFAILGVYISIGGAGKQVYAEEVVSAPTQSAALSTSMLEGIWVGTLNQEQSGVNGETQFSFKLDMRVNGNNVTGTSRIESSVVNPPAFGVMQFKGSYDSGILHYEETGITEQKPPPNSYWCIKKGDLTLSADGNTLSGKWDDPGCNAGMVSLRKTSVQKKPDLTCVITRWENIIPGIVGWPTESQFSKPVQRGVNNGWAVNLTAVVTVTVQNKGNGNSLSSNLVIKLKKANSIAQLKTVPLVSMRPGQVVPMTVNLQFTQDWRFFGDAIILAEVDSSNRIAETNETNNTSTHKILLADPRPDRKLEKIFSTRQDAVAYVKRLGFFEDDYFGLGNVGWAKYLTGAGIQSRRDGKLKNARAYRQDAVIVPYVKGGFAVAIQGTASFGEPNPNYLEDWLPYGDYVRWWHTIADY